MVREGINTRRLIQLARALSRELDARECPVGAERSREFARMVESYVGQMPSLDDRFDRYADTPPPRPPKFDSANIYPPLWWMQLGKEAP